MIDIKDNIEQLQEKLNKMIHNKSDSTKLYEISTELDDWIVKYYKHK